MKKYIIEFLKTVIPAILIAWAICTFLITNTVVPSGSMENTIPTGARVFGNRLYKNIERGDIMVFHSNYESYLLIKRVIGLPGDTVEIVPDGDTMVVKINGEILDEPYLKEPMLPAESQTFIVPEGHYLFFGDNRNASYDARYWEDPYIEEDEIIGKAVIMLWPHIKLM